MYNPNHVKPSFSFRIPCHLAKAFERTFLLKLSAHIKLALVLCSCEMMNNTQLQFNSEGTMLKSFCSHVAPEFIKQQELW